MQIATPSNPFKSCATPGYLGVESFTAEFDRGLEPWPESVDGGSLLEQLTQTFRRFVILPASTAELLALWTVHTYAFRLRDTTTYLGVESPEKRCGKTTLLTVLSELVHRPVVAANISPSALFRVIQEIQPTLLIDEADTFLRGNDEMRGILNSGYNRKTAYVVRVAWQAAVHGGREVEPGKAEDDTASEARSSGGALLARFSCWCPKVMAQIGRLPDALADRCIPIRMQRRTAEETCERVRKLEPIPLRRQCQRFVMDNEEAIRTAGAEIPAGLNDRAADIWEPLLVLAELAGPGWAEKAREIAGALSSSGHESSPNATFITDIFKEFSRRNEERMFSRSLVWALNQLESRPWMELTKGKPITELWLAQQLRQYGIRPKSIWIGSDHARGYEMEEVMDVLRRYVTKAEAEAIVQMG